MTARIVYSIIYGCINTVSVQKTERHKPTFKAGEAGNGALVVCATILLLPKRQHKQGKVLIPV